MTIKRKFDKIFVLAFTILFASVNTAYPLPQIDEVVSGDIEVQYTDANTMQINASDSTIINYTSFNIGDNESVIIILPSSSSEILNKVIGGETGPVTSQLFGKLGCNGLFILVNTAGIHVGPNANINAGSLVLATRDINNNDFLAGDYIFKKLHSDKPDRYLLNEGTITIKDGGFGVLIAGAIENKGKIIAPIGKIALAAGDAVRLNISNNKLISVVIDEKTASTIVDHKGDPITDQIKNAGTIEANGGVVILKAESLTDIFTKSINLDGYVRANRIEGHDGTIKIVADNDVAIRGTLEATDIEIGDPDGLVPYNVRVEEEASLNAEDTITVLARNDIEIHGDITTGRGDITFVSDHDNDNTGQFRHISGTLIPGEDGSIYVNGLDFGKGINLSGLPLYFIPNTGQIDDESVKYYVQVGNNLYYFTQSSVYFMFNSVDPENEGTFCWVPIYLEFLGANEDISIASALATGAMFNYFLGNDPSQHMTDVSSYYQIVYESLYDGIDLIYTSKDGNLESEFMINPGANYEDIEVRYNNIESLGIDENGNLVIRTETGELIETRPYVYQDIGGTRYEIDAQFSILSEDTYGFIISGEYNPTHTLVVDPTLGYSTYLGGDDEDWGFADNTHALVVDSGGNAYMTGKTESTNFPHPNAYQGALRGGDGDMDALIAKLDSSGNLVYATYLGGNSNDEGHGIALDGSGNIYVTGTTESANFYSVNAKQPNTGSGVDAFFTKLNDAGSVIQYSTYLGGSMDDYSHSIAVDSSGNAYITGHTESSDFPLSASPYQTDQTATDAFVAKFDPTESGDASLKYSTYLGGNGSDIAHSIAVDSDGHAYVVGETTSTNFPDANAYEDTLTDGKDAFFTKLNAFGSDIEYSTYLGGGGDDIAYCVAIDGDGKAYITGETNSSTDFPTKNAYDNSYNAGTWDGFIAKFDPTESGDSSLACSTYFGGSGADRARSIALDSEGNVYIAGYTDSSDLKTEDPHQSSNAGGTDVFLSEFDSSVSSLLYSTYFGGADNDLAGSIAIDTNDRIYVCGRTEDNSADPEAFPTKNAYQDSHAGGTTDMFIFMFEPPEASAAEDPDSPEDEDIPEPWEGNEPPSPDPPENTDEDDIEIEEGGGEEDFHISPDEADEGDADKAEGDKADEDDEDKSEEDKEDGEDEGDSETSEGDSAEGDGEDDTFGSYGKGGYEKHYPAGKYRTVVIVYEGKVAVAPYDAQGPRFNEGTMLTTGQKIAQVGEIK